MLHEYVLAALALSITEFPWQKVVAPPGVTVGAGGAGFTVTAVAEDTSEQPFAFVTVTV